MSAVAFSAVLESIWPHATAVALCALRLFPVVLLSPVLGGQVAPTTVRLSVTLALAGSLHLAGGVSPAGAMDAWDVAAAGIRELLFGVALGLIAALPFDTARIAGRFIDLFRGTSAEASLPVAGTRESATGDGLYQWTTGLAVAAGAASTAIAALWRSFAIVPVGAANASAALSEHLVTLIGTAMATGLAIGAPIAGFTLAVDAALGLMARAAPGLHVSELAAPVRILGGGAVLWVGAGLFADRLLQQVVASEGWMQLATELAR